MHKLLAGHQVVYDRPSMGCMLAQVLITTILFWTCTARSTEPIVYISPRHGAHFGKSRLIIEDQFTCLQQNRPLHPEHRTDLLRLYFNRALYQPDKSRDRAK